MSWTDPTLPQVQSDDMSNIQILQPPVQQTVTILQQLPAIASTMPPQSSGGIREDLVELMMMQNAQMHQVIMNNMTMSALSTFGYTYTPEHTTQLEEPIEEAEVHHYYQYSPYLSDPAWMPMYLPLHQMQESVLQNVQSFRDPTHPLHPVHTQHRDRRDVPPPPPPSATGTVTDIPPAAEYYEAERSQ